MVFRIVVALVAAAMLITFLWPVVFKLQLLPLFVVAGIGVVMMLWEQWETIRDDDH
jgi:4-hydroxybenzoate polyprenyltransferase